MSPSPYLRYHFYSLHLQDESCSVANFDFLTLRAGANGFTYLLALISVFRLPNVRSCLQSPIQGGRRSMSGSERTGRIRWVGERGGAAKKRKRCVCVCKGVSSGGWCGDPRVAWAHGVRRRGSRRGGPGGRGVERGGRGRRRPGAERVTGIAGRVRPVNGREGGAPPAGFQHCHSSVWSHKWRVRFKHFSLSIRVRFLKNILAFGNTCA